METCHNRDKEKTHIQWVHGTDAGAEDHRSEMPGDAAVQQTAAGEQVAGAPARGASGLEGSSPRDHALSPSLGQAGPVPRLAQHLHSKGRRSRERMPSFPGPGRVPCMAVSFPATVSSWQEGPSVSQCSHEVSSSSDLKEIVFSLVAQQPTTTLILVILRGLSLSFLASSGGEVGILLS